LITVTLTLLFSFGGGVDYNTTILIDELLRRRKSAGLTQAAFAVKNGIGLSTVCGFESGRIRRLSVSIVAKLAAAYGTTVADIQHVLAHPGESPAGGAVFAMPAAPNAHSVFTSASTLPADDTD
jgi:transcriptional regulator with XRE-family HTH domain